MSSKFETSFTFHNHKRRSKTPSFSSTLLEAIYRSIDDDHHHHHHRDHGYYPRTTPTSPTHSTVKQRDRHDIYACRSKLRNDSTLETLDLRRAILIESWIEKQPQKQQQNKHYFHLGDNVDDEKVRIIRQKSVPSRAPGYDDNLSSSSCFLAQRSSSREQSSSRIFTKTKSRAMKIYGELKKSKSHQNSPISPGRRIAAFLNSIFKNTSNSSTSLAKSSPENPPPPAMTTTSNSTCSTASSFSRSCLSNKTSSSSGKSTPATTKTKRSVKFYPVSVILDEDSRPCGHKSLHKDDENEGFKKVVSPRPVNGSGDEQKWRRDKEIDASVTMIKANCGDNNVHHLHHHQVSRFEKCFDGQAMEEDKDEEDDIGSCGSSDLFELDNLSSIGVGDVSRYYEELPVYGTTSLKNITT